MSGVFAWLSHYSNSQVDAHITAFWYFFEDEKELALNVLFNRLSLSLSVKLRQNSARTEERIANRMKTEESIASFIPVFSQLRSQPTGQSFPYIISILHSLCWNSVNSARLSTNEI